MNEYCVVFTCDKAYFNKFINTCHQLITIGKYNGPICLMIGDDLFNDELLNHPFIISNNINIQHFVNITFPQEFLNINNLTTTDGRNLHKKFQWHKMHLFNVFFKKWRYIFYLDAGITIFDDISPILQEFKENSIVAHSDAYPTYQWKLHSQFEKNNDLFTKLDEKYNLNIDYFQTTILLYDTNIIHSDTFDNLYKLSLEYPICKTNEQGIIALYFTNIFKLFKQITTNNEYTYFYDYMDRNINCKYIMLKVT
jgi:hypothetical protein